MHGARPALGSPVLEPLELLTPRVCLELSLPLRIVDQVVPVGRGLGSLVDHHVDPLTEDVLLQLASLVSPLSLLVGLPERKLLAVRLHPPPRRCFSLGLEQSIRPKNLGSAFPVLQAMLDHDDVGSEEVEVLPR